MLNINSNSYDELKTYYDTILNSTLLQNGNVNDVPTPIGCIEEILQHIPSNVWADANLSFFDPCCGNGNWHLVAWHFICKAMPGTPNNSITKRFYFNDINPGYLATVADIFAIPKGMENSNMSCTDFLTCFTQHTHAHSKYDIVMANPPYAQLMKNGKRSAKNHNLIGAFVEKSLHHVKENGFLIFLVPDSWMSLSDRNTKYVELLTTQCAFFHLNIHRARKWFPKIGSTFTWFIVQKKPATTLFTPPLCVVEGTHMGLTFSSKTPVAARQYLPLVITSEVMSILQKTLECSDYSRFDIQTSSDLHKHTKRHLLSDVHCEHSHPHRVIHTFNKTVYSSKAHKFQDGYKVFISLTNNYETLVDDCGMTQSVAFIRCADLPDANRKKRMLDHELYVFLNNICRWGNFNNIRIIQKFPMPPPPINSCDELYDYFGITDIEQQFIRTFLQSTRTRKQKENSRTLTDPDT
jgi:adenine-specific DNA-methyltransferase